MAKKSIKTKKINIVSSRELLDIVYQLKDGRSDEITYGGHFEDEYLTKLISQRVAKLKLGDKLIISPRECVEIKYQ